MSDKTIDLLTFNIGAKTLLTWIKEHASIEVVSEFINEFAMWDEYSTGVECDTCGTTISYDSVCVFCGATLVREFTVTFTFSVTVTAKDSDTAAELASDNVSVDDGYDDNVTYNYDLEVNDTSETW